MAGTSVLKAFLFTDIVGATALKRRVGDVAGANAITEHDRAFRECLAQFGGQEHENPGDGFFASFELPSDAIRCALAFQRALSEANVEDPVSVRVGVHMGESVCVAGPEDSPGKGKLLGLAVDTAARVMGLAQADQILLTRHAFDSVRQQVSAAPDGATIEWLAHGAYDLKGIDEPVEIFEAGVKGISPLSPPPDTANAKRVVAPGDEKTLGWRPAVDLEVPGRESWVLERQIGEGGFGEVWLARHKETKYVRTFKFCYEADKLRSLRRELKLFRLMKEVLGDRPDIARLYEVRLTEPPYFLEMEYTAGGNLSEWAETRGGIEAVPMETRLELVAQVGAALAAAHSVGVIHKDVKPANVLIHEKRDGQLQVRLTDFGIGELLRKDRLKEAGMTVSMFESVAALPRDQYNTLTGTQLYMAPELLAGQPSSIKTDVYALGVLLFQMCAGSLKEPIAHGWESRVDDELLREDIAACVAGDPNDRLSSPDDLSDRLRALPERRAQRAAERKRAAHDARRRNLFRVVSVLAAFLVVVVGATGVGLWRTERARQRAKLAETMAREEAERANHEAERAERVLTFLQDMLASANPATARGEDLTVRELLDQAAEDLDADLNKEPETAARIHVTLGTTYYSLGLYDESARHLERAWETMRADAGDDDPEVLRVAASLGGVYTAQGRAVEAETLLRDTLERQRRILGENNGDMLTTMEHLVEVLVPLEQNEDVESLYRKIYDARRQELGGDDSLTLRALNNLGGFLRRTGKLEEAEKCYRLTLDAQMRVLGDDHPETLMTLNNLAATLKAQGNLEEAEPLYRKALEGLRRVLGEKHPTVLAGTNNLASVLMDLRRYDESEPLFEQAWLGLREAIGEEHPTTLLVRHNHARMIYERGEPARAAEMLDELLKVAERVLPADHAHLARFRATAGDCYRDLGRFDDAERELLASAQVLGASENTEVARGALKRIVALYEAWDKPDRAAEYREKLEQLPAGEDQD